MVRLCSNGDYWQARWVATTGERMTRSLGPKRKLSKRAAEKACAAIALELGLKPAKRDRSRSSRLTLKAWCEQYITLREGDIAAGTLAMDRSTITKLRAYFGSGELLESITPARADDWVRWLRVDMKGVSAHGHLRRARTLFAWALRRQLIDANPFAHTQCPSGTDRRETWAEESMIAPLLAAAPSEDWRRLLALVAYTGCRRSEATALRWGQVDFEGGRIAMPNIKTKGSTGADARTVRLEPALAEILQEEGVGEPGQLVCGSPAVDLYRGALRIYRRAGLECPGDPFRVWRRWRGDSWLAAGFPDTVVDQWLGHSRDIARRHYDGVPPEFYGEASPLTALREAEAEIARLRKAMKTGTNRGTIQQVKSKARS